MNISSAKKILIIRFSSLGDVLLTTPVIRSLKKRNNILKIDFLVRKQYEDALKYNPHLNELIIFEQEKAKTIAEYLKSKRYDLVIDLQNNFRSRKICSALRLPVYKYKKPNLKKFLLVKFKINLLKDNVSAPERYSRAFPEGGIKLDNFGAELFIPQNIRPISENNDKNVGLCPGSKHFTKMWPGEYFAEAGNLLIEKGYNIFLFGGQDDKEICGSLSSKIKGSVNLCNDNDLLRTAAEMKQCGIVICNDSGLMHTATAVNVPVIAIFGSTVREFGFAPYRSEGLILENNSLSCRPCSHIGRDRCPKNHFKCMTDLQPALLLDKFFKLSNSL